MGRIGVGGTRHGHRVMSLHKLTAGDGYTYLTRQVAAADGTHRGRDGLAEYYSQQGESPGVWLGHGADGLTQFVAPTEAMIAGSMPTTAAAACGPGAAGARLSGSPVTETQMLALFGKGRHPDAAAIEKQLSKDGHGVQTVLSATRLGSPYQVASGPSPFRVELARRFKRANAQAGLPGDWPIPEAERAAIRTQLAREMFQHQYGRGPLNSRELSGLLARASRQQSTAVAGYDLTFTPVKSVSALWAVAPREVALAIEQAHTQAVEQCLSWLEEHAAYTRLGRGGARQVEVRGLIAAAFTHRDSRAGDPNLHTHVAVSNKVQVADTAGADAGRWLALDGRPLHKLAVAASERYNTRLEALLRDALGVEFTERVAEQGKRAVREVVGVDERLLRTWSARRVMIDVRRGELAGQFQGRHGRPPGPVEAIKLAQQATLETRQAKHQPRSHAEQRRAWRADALRVLGTAQALSAMLDGALQGLRARRDQGQGRPQPTGQLGPDRTRPAPSQPGDRWANRSQRRRRQPAGLATLDTPNWVANTAEQVLLTVQNNRATWQQAHVRAEAERAVRAANLPLGRVDAAVERIVAAALSPAWSLPLGVPEPVSEPAALRRRDGTSVYATAGAQLFTSPGVVAAERALLALAQRAGGRVVSPEAVELALLGNTARGVDLNPGQIAMVRQFATNGRLLQLALAPAGTGKTTAMQVLAAAWQGDGGHVIGLAPSAAAAAVLGQELNRNTADGPVATDTLAKLIFSLDTLDQQAGRAPAHPIEACPRGPVPQWVHRIGPDTLVVLDEAGMAGTPALARAATWITGRGACLRLIGDDAQLAAVGAGGVLRDLAETAGALTLSQVVRFHDPAEGAASLALRAGQRAAIGFYLDHDRIHVGDPTTGIDAAYRAWSADRQAGLDALMLAPTREVTAQLNARARTDRLAAWSTTGSASSAPTVAAGPQVRLSDGSAASAGDTVVTRRNNRRLALSATDWIKNGDRWTVREVLPDGALKVQHLSTRRIITLPADYTRAHVALGYASTVHAAQGSTADTCHTVATGAENRQLLYVAMTRGRTGNHLYLSTASDGDEHSVLTPDVLLPPTAVDLLTRIVDRNGAQVSATTTQRQLADPAVRLAAAADRYHDSLHVAALERLGPGGVAALDAAAEQALPGLTTAPAWATLQASLALHAATDPTHRTDSSATNPADPAADPVALAVQSATRVLNRALAQGEVRSAADPAAVLDWRLDLPHPNRPRPTQCRPTAALPPGTARTQTPGPLAWLPAIPLGLETDPSWGIYLQARHGYTTMLAEQLADRARAWTPTSAPAWAAPLLGAERADDLIAELAVWRAAQHVDDNDLNPTGPSRLPTPDARTQTTLNTRVTRALGDPAAAANRWRTLAQHVEPRLLDDPFWPALADRLAAADRAAIDINGLVLAAVRTDPAHQGADDNGSDGAAVDASARQPVIHPPEPGPLPDELPAAALWWRLSRQIAPAALTARACDLGAGSAARPNALRPAWTGQLHLLLGGDLADRVAADPAWPALVAAVTHATAAGWTAEQVLTTAHQLLYDAHCQAHTDAAITATAGGGPGPAAPRPAELATALAWRVAILTDAHSDIDQAASAVHDADAPVDPENAPVDPVGLEMLPPDDLYYGLDQALQDSFADTGASRDTPHTPPDPDEHTPPSRTEQEPPIHPCSTVEDGGQEQDAPAWLSLAPVRDQLDGQAHLWQPLSGHQADADIKDATDPASTAASPTGTDEPTAAPHAHPAGQVCRERLLELNAQALAFYSGAYNGSWAQQHLQQRLGTDLTNDPRFTPGYAPAGWTYLVEHLRSRGATDHELLQAGLATPARTGRLIDRFRDRLILPIQTLDTNPGSTTSTNPAARATTAQAEPASPVVQVVGFVGRRRPDAADNPDGSSPAGPKYLNTADNPVFSKGAQLYGAAESAAALAAGAVPVLVEGPLDALAVTLAAGGDAVGVAPLGTAFTDAQADTLRPYLRSGPATTPACVGDRPAPGVIVATDNDAAGRKAATRAYWLLVARGANPGHLVLPDGLDPAELLATAGPQALHATIAMARRPDSTLARALVTDRVAGYADRLNTAEGTVLAARAAARVIGALPPEHWLEHISHLDTLIDAAAGITHLEVIDAGLAWSADHYAPHGQAGRPADHAPTDAHVQAQPPAPAVTPVPSSTLAPAPATDAPATAVTVPGHTPEPAQNTAPQKFTAQWASARWHDLGVAVDPRLVTGTDWPALAASLERASRAGYDVQQHLPRLAAAKPLPDEQPARTLRGRLLEEAPAARFTASSKTRWAADRQRIAEATAAQGRGDAQRHDIASNVPPRPGPAR